VDHAGSADLFDRGPDYRALPDAEANPNAKVAILYQNDEFGKDFMNSFKEILAEAGGSAKVDRRGVL
jgi:ABC-type branched-subunit amino acid transport system substrate-binding protein